VAVVDGQSNLRLLFPMTSSSHRTGSHAHVTAFPTGFTWGAATAAYQIEGSGQADGKGSSIWDAFSHQPGRIFENQNGDIACDHYRRWREDIRLLRQLRVKAYRFSIAWSRLLPTGAGRINAKGLAFYERLVDALLEAEITPWITLYHWDLPLALQRRGGFLNRDFVEWFGDYASLVAKHLGDRARHWITINEPQVVTGLGLQDGIHAPGLKLPYADCLLAAHHLLMGHGRAVQALRSGCRDQVNISLANCGPVAVPHTKARRNIEAARRFYFSSLLPTMWNLSWWADPVIFGRYPDDGVKAHRASMPQIKAGDMALISQPIDFLAHNCYSGYPVRAGVGRMPERLSNGWGPGNARGTLPWLEIAGDALYWAARFQTERYHLPVVFTENGFCNTDFVHLDGAVHDPQRIDYLERYLQGLKRALAEGVPVHGYFYWSLLDNLEWAEGFKDRFGLVHVDFRTQKRTPKDSYHWYRNVIASHGASLENRGD
jgi:beta-glucosidase